jgi:Legume lectin domain/Chitobiase/beta-hexosaminidase C-terminal domain
MFQHPSVLPSAVRSSFSSAIGTLARPIALALVTLALFLVSASNLSAQTTTLVTVPTWRYDNTHSGANTQETELTPANVNVNTFGKLFSQAVDGLMYAQPLYVPGLTMSDGKVHNVLFLATENDSLYAFDADSNGGANAAPIWKVSLLDSAHGAGAGATAVPYQDTASPDVAPTIGITGTPVINPATNTMYVVSATKENGAYFSRLHAINLLTGAEQANSPVDITATVNGTGNGSSGGKLTFSPLWANQRPALNYYNGYVYIGYSAHGDNGPYHGWLFAYNATTLAQSAALCLSPNDYGAGIWGPGAGMPIDDDATGGRMFVVTGNGDQSAYPPFTPTTSLGESVVNFSLANGGLTPTDAYTAFNKTYLNSGDYDFGAGGLLMPPDQQSANPHILVVAGKEGRIVVLNRDNLGGYDSDASDPKALQDITGQLAGCWCAPAYWNGKVYIWGELPRSSQTDVSDSTGNVPQAFDLDSGVLGTTAFTQSSIHTAFPSPSFSISSNGTEDGIAWAVRTDQFNTHGAFVLYAWDAGDLTTPIYESDTNATRDAGGPANRYSIPMVANGKVYVVANGQVDVYGLLNGEPTAAAPSISPNGGTFSASQTVTLTSATASASIYYTLDGSTPIPASKLYTDPITISTDTTLKAISSASGYIQSGVTTATFTFTGQTPAVAVQPAGGTYVAAQKVTLSDTDANAKIYYTADGSAPSASSILYSAPIQVPVSETIKAIAIDPSLQNSNVTTAAYVIQGGGESINFGMGFSSTAGLTLNGSAVATNDTRLQLTNGGLNQAGSVFWNTPINIQAFTTTFEFQLSVAQGNGFTFTIQNVAPTALGSSGAGLGYQGIAKSVAVKFNFYNSDNEGSDSTGLYTGGAAPTLPTVDLTPSGIELNSGDSIQATISYDGTNLTLKLLDFVNNHTYTMSDPINISQAVGGNTAYVGFTGSTGTETASQKLITWTYATQSVPPAFAPAAGTYSTAQNVVLSSATADASIHYTTDGTTPTAASIQYSSPIAAAASETIKAIAVSPTVGTSNLASAAYVIQPVSAASFALAASAPAPFAQGGSASSTVTITPSGGFTGMVALTCAISAGPSGATSSPTCSVQQPASISGTSAVTSPLTINTQAATTTGAYTATVTGTAGSTVQTTTVAFTVKVPTTPPSFTLSSTSVMIGSPGTSATSTITVTPTGGFTGTVSLACAVTSNPTGAVDPPTCSATQPAAISGSNPVTSTVTISTTAPSTAALHNPLRKIFQLGGGTFAALLFFCVPFRRRKWQSLFGLLIFVAIAATVSGCGGGGSMSGGGSGNSGTTAGNYTVTVTATSGSTTATTAVTVTVS